EVRGDADARRQPGSEPIFRDVCDTGGDRAPWVARPRGLPGHAHRAPRRRPHPGNRLGELALPVPRNTRDGDDLAAPDREGDVALCVAATVSVGPAVLGPR